MWLKKQRALPFVIKSGSVPSLSAGALGGARACSTYDIELGSMAAIYIHKDRSSSSVIHT